MVLLGYQFCYVDIPESVFAALRYFGLEGEREHTLEEIGNMLGVTRERIRQLRDRALRRLREGGKGDALESFAA